MWPFLLTTGMYTVMHVEMHCWSLASQIKCWSALLIQALPTAFYFSTSMGWFRIWHS